MSNWIECQDGTLLNRDNILKLKVHKATCEVRAECVSNVTLTIQSCKNRDEAIAVMRKLAELKPLPKKDAPKKPEVQKPAPKKKAPAPRKKRDEEPIDNSDK